MPVEPNPCDLAITELNAALIRIVAARFAGAASSIRAEELEKLITDRNHSAYGVFTYFRDSPSLSLRDAPSAISGNFLLNGDLISGFVVFVESGKIDMVEVFVMADRRTDLECTWPERVIEFCDIELDRERQTGRPS